MASSPPPSGMVSLPATSLSSSPSSRAPSSIDDLSLSDVSSLDDEDYELVDGRTPSALHPSVDLSSSVDGASASWLTEGTPSESAPEDSAVIFNRSVFPDQLHQGGAETPLDQSFARFEGEQASQAWAGSATDSLLSPSNHLADSLETTGPGTPSRGGGSGGSGTSAVSNWILPDPNSPENSTHLKSCSNSLNSEAFPLTDKMPSHQTAQPGTSRMPTEADPVWRSTLGASWEKTLNSEISSGQEQSDSLDIHRGLDAEPDSPERKMEGKAHGEQFGSTFEPDWAQKTKEWLKINSSKMTGTCKHMPPSAPTSATGDNGDMLPCETEKSTRRSIHKVLRTDFDAARVSIKTSLSSSGVRGVLGHWLVAALCGFMGAVVLLHPSLPAETVSEALSFAARPPFLRFHNTYANVPSTSAVKASFKDSGSFQSPQMVQSEGTNMPHQHSSLEVLLVHSDPSELQRPHSLSEPSSSIKAEKEALPPVQPFALTEESKAWSLERLQELADEALRLLRSGILTAKHGAANEWKYWEARLRVLWFEIMEPMIKQFNQEFKGSLAALEKDLSKGAAWATAYGKVAATAANHQAGVLLQQSSALRKAMMEQAETIYNAHLRDSFAVNKQRAEKHFDSAVKAAGAAWRGSSERASVLFQTASEQVDFWASEAQKVSEAGKEKISDLHLPDSVARQTEQLLHNAIKGKQAVFDVLQRQRKAVKKVQGKKIRAAGKYVRNRGGGRFSKTSKACGGGKTAKRKKYPALPHDCVETDDAFGNLFKASWHDFQDALAVQRVKAEKEREEANKRFKERVESLRNKLKRT